MTVLERKEQIQEEQQKAFEELQVAQSRVTELTALIQRQNGAITALQSVLDEESGDSTAEVAEAVEELVEV